VVGIIMFLAYTGFSHNYDLNTATANQNIETGQGSISVSLSQFSVPSYQPVYRN